MRLAPLVIAVLSTLGLAGGSSGLAAQTEARSARPARGAAARTPATPQRVAMLDVAFYGRRATDIRPDDSTFALLATAVLRRDLATTDSIALVDSATVARATRSPEALAAANDRPCNVVVACARAVGKVLGVRWVFMGKLSKTSDLIWVMTGDMVDVPTGKLVEDDSYELKGNVHQMVIAGMRVLASRIVQVVHDGGTPPDNTGT